MSSKARVRPDGASRTVAYIKVTLAERLENPFDEAGNCYILYGLTKTYTYEIRFSDTARLQKYFLTLPIGTRSPVSFLNAGGSPHRKGVCANSGYTYPDCFLPPPFRFPRPGITGRSGETAYWGSE